MLVTSSIFQFMGHFLCALTRDNCFPYNAPVTPENDSRTSRSQVWASSSDNEIPNYGHSGSVPDLPITFLPSGGGVEGYVMKTIRSRRVAAFEGIPYGKPPIGRLRFRVCICSKCFEASKLYYVCYVADHGRMNSFLNVPGYRACFSMDRHTSNQEI
jgi:hypothetical protein